MPTNSLLNNALHVSYSPDMPLADFRRGLELSRPMMFVQFRALALSCAAKELTLIRTLSSDHERLAARLLGSLNTPKVRSFLFIPAILASWVLEDLCRFCPSTSTGNK
jgi:hypothetical protein